MENTNTKNSNLLLLTDSIIQHKTFLFSQDEFNFDHSLIENGILKITNNEYKVVDFTSISHYIFNIYLEKFNFSLKANFKRNIKFLQKIKKDFCDSKYVEGFNSLDKELWKIAVKLTNSQFGNNFNSYLKSSHKNGKPKKVYKFIQAYSIQLDNLDLNENEIYDNCILLLEITKSDAHYNAPLGIVLNGINLKIKKDYEAGLTILEKLLSDKDSNSDFISSVVCGLYEGKRDIFYTSILKNHIEHNTKLDAIFFGLARVSDIGQQECELFIELFDTHHSNEPIINSLLSLMFSIINSENVTYHEPSYNRIISCTSREESGIFILNKLYLGKVPEIWSVNLFITIIKQPYFSIKKYMYLIGNSFYDIKELDPFKTITLCLIECKPFESFIKYFKSYLRKLNNSDLDEFMIELLTSNLASKRFIGLELFKRSSSHRPYKFTLDILTLDPLVQYKLWVALTIDFSEPKNRLTALLPLLKSKNIFIRESFLYKLEELSEDYGGHITEVLESNLNTDNREDTKIIQKIKSYIENYYSDNVDIKFKAKELNPFYTSYKNLRQFQDLFQKKLRESLDGAEKEHSFLGAFTGSTIILAKGGGWKVGNRNDIAPLSSFPLSFSMPRSYFINPNGFEIEKSTELRRDWTDDEFNHIKTWIKNE